MSEQISYAVREGIALVELNAAKGKVNILDAVFLRELAATAERLRQEPGVIGAVVASAKQGGFIAGADIGEIERIVDPAEGSRLAAEGQRILGLWAALPFPVVAAVHGHCMGGGTEFILACSHRVASADAAIALPEVKLGIFPGFGGTQRLPRLIGIEKSLDLILSGRTVRGAEALRLGLVDRLASVPDKLREEAQALAREAARDPQRLAAERRRLLKGWRSLLLEKNRFGRELLFGQARRRLLRTTGGHYPAPLKALEVIREGMRLSLAEGLALEARDFGPVAVTPVSKNLVQLYNLSQRAKKPFGKAEGGPVRTAAVLGAGVMGGGIAQLLAAQGMAVILKDIQSEAVDRGLAHAREIFRRQLARKGGDTAAVEEKMRLITGTLDYRDFANADLVIEAVVEKMAVKQAVLRETEPHLSDKAVFATNTSALSVSELQSVASRPERVGGMHFFNPVDRMPLVEVIRGEKTSEQTLALLHAAVLSLGKTPIVAADRPGFLVNRLLMAYLNEAGLIAQAGFDWLRLDRQVVDFGMPMGPFRLIDEVGIDIAAEVSNTLCAAFPYLERTRLLEMATRAGLRGKKGGSGFYTYGKKGPRPNSQAESALDLKRGKAPGETEMDRMLLLMVNEAGRCLAEGVVGAAEDVDTGMVFGTGFPPFRGGLCRWADSRGLESIVRRLEELARAHGPRFEPSRYLRGRKRFYA